MTKLQELKAAYVAAADNAEATRDEARDAADDAWGAYQAELKKTKKQASGGTK